MGDVLDRIDATLDGLCACGCGAHVAPDGRSAWFATERCQQRWQAQQVGAPGPPQPLDVSLWVNVDTAEWEAGVSAAFDEAARVMAITVEQCAENIRQLVEAFAAAGALEEPPPADPRERALAVRRNRNTGPAPRRGRPPREIPPTRSRR